MRKLPLSEITPALEAMHILAEVRTFDEAKPVLAGGAPRDLVLGKEVKDYDLFLPIVRCELLGVAIDIVDRFRAAGFEPDCSGNTQAEYSEGYTGRPEMLGVVRVPELRVDVVLFDIGAGERGSEIARTFDNSLSRIWVESYGRKKARVECRPEFESSVLHKVIFTDPDIPTRLGHLLRVGAKYPEYRLHLSNPAHIKVLAQMRAEDPEAYADYIGGANVVFPPTLRVA